MSREMENKSGVDAAEAPREKPKKTPDEYRERTGIRGFFYRVIWWGTIRLYLATYHRSRIHGRENVPADPPFVLIANHSSHLDTMLLGCVVTPLMRSRTYPIAAGDTFFETPVVSWFSAVVLNALPMWRKRCGRHAMAELKARLVEEGCAYILFPEGTRTRDGSMGRFKPGLGMLIAESNVPIVPCYIEGAFRAMPPGARIPRPARLRVHIGKPLDFSKVPDSREGWEQMASEMEKAVAALRDAAEKP